MRVARSLGSREAGADRVRVNAEVALDGDVSPDVEERCDGRHRDE